MGGKLKLGLKNKQLAQKPRQPAAPTDPQAAMKAAAGRVGGGLFGGKSNRSNENRSRFGGIKKILQGQMKPAIPPSPLQTPGKPMGQAQPLQASPLSPEQPPQSPSIPFKESTVQQPKAPVPTQPAPIVPPSPAQPIPASAAAPALAPQVVSPEAQMQEQKNQMFPAAAPAAPAAPVAPKPPQVTPTAGVTKSQAEIDEEKKKLQAAAGSPV